jgi:hypothetical protein
MERGAEIVHPWLWTSGFASARHAGRIASGIGENLRSDERGGRFLRRIVDNADCAVKVIAGREAQAERDGMARPLTPDRAAGQAGMHENRGNETKDSCQVKKHRGAVAVLRTIERVFHSSRQFRVFRQLDQKKCRMPAGQKDLTHCQPREERAQGGALGIERKAEQQHDGAGQIVISYCCHCALLSAAEYGRGFGGWDKFFEAY